MIVALVEKFVSSFDTHFLRLISFAIKGVVVFLKLARRQNMGAKHNTGFALDFPNYWGWGRGHSGTELDLGARFGFL